MSLKLKVVKPFGRLKVGDKHIVSTQEQADTLIEKGLAEEAGEDEDFSKELELTKKPKAGINKVGGIEK